MSRNLTPLSVVVLKYLFEVDISTDFETIMKAVYKDPNSGLSDVERVVQIEFVLSDCLQQLDKQGLVERSGKSIGLTGDGLLFVVDELNKPVAKAAPAKPSSLATSIAGPKYVPLPGLYDGRELGETCMRPGAYDYKKYPSLTQWGRE